MTVDLPKYLCKTDQMRSAFIVILLIGAIKCMAATHYVVPTNSSAADPYTNWATAGTNIIDVVNAAMTNTGAKLVWVTNGIYYPTNQIDVASALTLQSVNGRNMTILHGGLASAGSNRCISLASGSTFDGFTVTNYSGASLNGTIYALNGSRIVNCLITSNRVVGGVAGSGYGGGIFAGASVTITNCIIRGNYSGTGIGGVLIGVNCVVFNSTISDNVVGAYYGAGIGSYASLTNITISNCFIVNNMSWGSQDPTCGGGVCIYNGGANNKIISCVITGNVLRGTAAKNPRGGGVFISGAGKCDIINCNISGNSATNGGGIYETGPAYISVQNCLIAGNMSASNGAGIFCTTGLIENCTIASNCADVSGGGLYMNTLSATGINNIIYFNTAGVSANNFTNTAGNTGLNYSCVIPAVGGEGNITNDPRLVDLAGGNYRLCVNSPCVNAGTNQAWMTGTVDLDGSQRIRYGIVDMGAYEAVLRRGNIYRVR